MPYFHQCLLTKLDQLKIDLQILSLSSSPLFVIKSKTGDLLVERR